MAYTDMASWSARTRNTIGQEHIAE
jgi:hypothetical protein